MFGEWVINTIINLAGIGIGIALLTLIVWPFVPAKFKRPSEHKDPDLN